MKFVFFRCQKQKRSENLLQTICIINGISHTALVQWTKNILCYKHPYTLAVNIIIIKVFLVSSYLLLSKQTIILWISISDVKDEYSMEVNLQISFLNNFRWKQIKFTRWKYSQWMTKICTLCVCCRRRAFPLEPNIMKPYPRAHKKGLKFRIFNYRLNRARRVVKNAFGILSAVFRILRKPLLLEPNKTKKAILACIYLHNYLRKRKTSKPS